MYDQRWEERLTACASSWAATAHSLPTESLDGARLNYRSTRRRPACSKRKQNSAGEVDQAIGDQVGWFGLGEFPVGRGLPGQWLSGDYRDSSGPGSWKTAAIRPPIPTMIWCRWMVSISAGQRWPNMVWPFWFTHFSRQRIDGWLGHGRGCPL
ncbi:hypothetical protein DSL92_06275 [Billgrantia gudaonensis]|uniref:Uncharacterized protein n=1 Tax=Billgrantia gudaonensis TaxID=376427 RepID=A0A3S0Q143_9GAMM|nr:hypothetical protein DSL92_06275 [Halomonas gudaonensis]